MSTQFSSPIHDYNSRFNSLGTVSIGVPLRSEKEAVVAYFFRSSRKEGEISEQSVFRPETVHIAHIPSKSRTLTASAILLSNSFSKCLYNNEQDF